jgi:Isochorismatase family
LWNSATLVPEKCYGAQDIEFTCRKDKVKKSELEISIGDGVRPGRAPDNFNETAANTGLGYHDAPWLVSESNPDGEYPFKFPLDKTALIMIDFQRDFVCPGGFGETLGNKVEDLQRALQPARNVLRAARALGMPIIHTLESHKSDLSDLLDNKFNRGDLPEFLRIGEELDLGRILVRGIFGNNIVDMVAPQPGEHLVFKPGT